MKNFDFQGFADFLATGGGVVGIYYYNAQLDKDFDQSKFKNQKEFFSRLREIPKFHLVLCKLLKRNITGTDKNYYIIKEDDINMAVDMVDGSADDKFDVAVLVSGDGDFFPAVRSVKRRGKNVKNVYFNRSSSRSLKNHCDNSIPLTREILNDFFKDQD